MKTTCFALALLATAAQAAPLTNAPAASQPRQEPFSETRYGIALSDPYRWMEQDARSADMVAWIKSASDHTTAELGALPERAAFAATLEKSTRAGVRYSDVQSAGATLFYRRLDPADRVPKLVVRQGGQGVAILEGERWIAPLGDEVRGALSANLARDLHARDVTGLPDNGRPLLRIKLDLRRFDSQPGAYALIDAAWSLRLPNSANSTSLACNTRVSENVGPGYDALVQGHQRAIAQLAEQIAAAARPFIANQDASCPQG